MNTVKVPPPPNVINIFDKKLRQNHRNEQGKHQHAVYNFMNGNKYLLN